MTKFTADTLLNLDFQDIGYWKQTERNNVLKYVLDRDRNDADKTLLDVRNALYAFVHGENVKYIGKTARSVRKRFIGYCNPGKDQVTNRSCNDHIREILRRGEHEAVRIYIFNPISYLRYGEFEINLAAGLEDALIDAFNPPWNGKKNGKAITEEASREEFEEQAQPISEAPVNSIDAPSRGVRESNIAIFQIKLGHAYYDSGFINPGVAASKFLGEHGDPIVVAFNDGTEEVDSFINRTANRNGSVRIVGHNPEIARWFQNHFKMWDTVNAQVIGPHRILLLRDFSEQNN